MKSNPAFNLLKFFINNKLLFCCLLLCFSCSKSSDAPDATTATNQYQAKLKALQS
ncbi:hypothetical protein BC659_0197 [Sediminibacterium goheungense]|uniref:Uncharacterized protein n=1 Tax=Sediminibacterium goheungense TaxID=1086393 RepID=A0A4R6J024_9BACT|nr:hypothetical protein BC659_0197 [Sediminibacterium goheungense]